MMHYNYNSGHSLTQERGGKIDPTTTATASATAIARAHCCTIPFFPFPFHFSPPTPPPFIYLSPFPQLRRRTSALPYILQVLSLSTEKAILQSLVHDSDRSKPPLFIPISHMMIPQPKKKEKRKEEKATHYCCLFVLLTYLAPIWEGMDNVGFLFFFFKKRYHMQTDCS
jgi:hypothetical protein